MALTKDNTYTNGDSRLFYLSDDVDNSSIGPLCWSLIFQLQADDKKEAKEKDFKREPIKLYINSYGGSVYDMWALIDIIVNSKTPIYTYCTGYAMSAAFKIFLSGHKRFCLKNSIALAHSGSGGASGTYEQTEAQMKDYKRFVDTMRKYIIDRTDIDTKTLNKYKNKEWYLYSEDQIKYRIVDKIIDDIYEIL